PLTRSFTAARYSPNPSMRRTTSLLLVGLLAMGPSLAHAAERAKSHKKTKHKPKVIDVPAAGDEKYEDAKGESEEEASSDDEKSDEGKVEKAPKAKHTEESSD